MHKTFKYLWAAPASLLGMAVVLLSLPWGGRAARQRGAVEVCGGFASWLLRRRPFRASAMTLGHVILGRDQFCLDSARDHEHVHVRQYERWGPLFIPLYLLLSAAAWLRGRHYYFDNPFEREAYDQAP